MGGPSIQDCEKSLATTGIPSANLLAKKFFIGLVHILNLPRSRRLGSPQPQPRSTWKYLPRLLALILPMFL